MDSMRCRHIIAGTYMTSFKSCSAAHTGHMDAALHGLQRGGPHSMDLMYPPVDDLDDDVGIVDAEVLELLLSRPS